MKRILPLLGAAGWLMLLCGWLAGSPAGADPAEEADPDLAEAIAADQRAQADWPAIEPVPARPTASWADFNPKLSLILTTSVAWHSSQEHLEQGGHAPDTTGFNLQGLELAASASVDPYFRFQLSFQLTEAEIEEAFLSTVELPLNLQLRAGFFNAQFGRENALHLHQYKFANPSLMHTRFLAEEHFAGLGAEASMLLPLPWYLMLIVESFSTVPDTSLRSASFVSADQTATGAVDGPEDFVFVARIENFFELTDDWSLLVGLSGATGPSPRTPDEAAFLWGADVYLKWRPLSSGADALAVALTLEYLLRQTPSGSGWVRDHGGYAQLDLQLSKRWLLGLRLDQAAWWSGPVAPDDPLGAWQWRGSAVLTFAPTHFSKLRLQYDAGHQRNFEGVGHAVVLLVEVSAGAHGAHSF
jgi:hypothetical protein